MGKGKGNVTDWRQTIRPNSILLEVAITSSSTAKIALTSASKKLPFKTKLILLN
jgi:large subunit ribosomal protein L16